MSTTKDGWTYAREYFDSLGECGHRIGALVFTLTGFRCPTCGHDYHFGKEEMATKTTHTPGPRIHASGKCGLCGNRTRSSRWAWNRAKTATFPVCRRCCSARAAIRKATGQEA